MQVSMRCLFVHGIQLEGNVTYFIEKIRLSLTLYFLQILVMYTVIAREKMMYSYIQWRHKNWLKDSKGIRESYEDYVLNIQAL